MNELIERHEADEGADLAVPEKVARGNRLVRALVEAGPVVHGGKTYVGSVDGIWHDLRVLPTPVPGARPSDRVDVPEVL